jgi:hypothetical protein
MKRPASVRVGLASADANALTSDLTGVLDSGEAHRIRRHQSARPGRNPRTSGPPGDELHDVRHHADHAAGSIAGGL